MASEEPSTFVHGFDRAEVENDEMVARSRAASVVSLAASAAAGSDRVSDPSRHTHASGHGVAPSVTPSPNEKENPSYDEKSGDTPPTELQNAPAAPVEDYPEGGFAAWSVVAGAWCVSFVTWGFVNAFGVFQEYYQTHQLADKTSSDISWIGSFQLAAVLGFGVFSGKAFDAGYAQHLIAIGTVIYVAGIFGLSGASSYATIFVTQALLCGLASGILFLPAASAVSHYFRRRRGLALGVLATGSSCGGVIFPILLNQLLVKRGMSFGWSVRICGFIILALLLVANAFIRSRLPARTTGALIDLRVFRDPILDLFVVGESLVVMGMYLPFFYVQSYALKKGVDSNISFYTVAILNGSSLFGRLIPNLFSDKYGPLNMLIPACFSTGVLCFAFTTACKAEASLIVFCIIYGFFSGTYVAIIPMCVASITERMDEFGIRLAMTFLFTMLPALSGTPISGAVIASCGYGWSAIVSAIFVLLGCAFLFTARWMISSKKHTWKV